MAELDSIPSVAVQRPSPDALRVRVSGDWKQPFQMPGAETVRQELNNSPGVKWLEFDTTGLTGWDSRFVAFVTRCSELTQARHVELRCGGIPIGVNRLLQLTQEAPPTETRHAAVKAARLRKLGESAARSWLGTVALFTFLGDTAVALGRLLRGRAQFRWMDAFLVMEETGPAALGIVALINFLVGMILAFVGELALKQFGAVIYVADLVGIGTVREMGGIMTGIIMTGRTGAAFAAQLGTMKVNEEINALQTFGISPIEFLVLPRMIALILMMPFLCVFADLISIFGGFCVSMLITDMTPAAYLHRTLDAIELKTFVLGIVKGSVFGFLVAYTGCLRGIQSGYSAAAVGQATTQAVVAGITAIIATDGVFAALSRALNI